MSLVEVSEEGAFNNAVQSSNKDLLVAYFWAGFHEACQKGGQIDQVLGVLQTRYGNVDFLKADAEALGDVAEKFGVSMVPSFVFIKNGQKVDLTEGANPVNLQNAIEKNLKSSSGSATGNSEDPTIEKIKRLIASSHVILFMKGSPAEPRCKFSRAMVELLNEQNVKFASFDILSDQDLREKLKTVSNWPTYPQLYVGGKLIGGLDAVKELAATDDGKGLRDIISKDVVAPPRVAKRPPTVPGGGTQREVNDEYLKELTTSSPVVLFMKGSPDEPSCGFSSKIVNLLREQKITFSSFDILQDQQVREKLKTFANWPTYPQLWVRGTLIGGLDIVQEMAEEGDLAEQLGIEPLEKRLEQLVNRAPVMLFMKGSPQEPRCGFSREMVRILDEEGTKYDTFDILEDEEVRQGLKTYSNWPTYPQLYVKGKLVGGLDIVKELKEEDELKETLAPSQL